MTDQPRTAPYAIEPLFLDRWSPRAFDGSAMPQADLDTIMEAARWAPSAFNYQPWRFLYAHRDSKDWPTFLSALMPFNQSWAQHASVLIYVLSDSMMDGKDGATPSHSHSFDTGAAWALLALQATRLGYQAHGMTGVDFDAARVALEIPDRFRLEAAAVIGRLGDKASLPEALQAREKPSDRKPIADFAFEGRLPA